MTTSTPWTAHGSRFEGPHRPWLALKRRAGQGKQLRAAESLRAARRFKRRTGDVDQQKQMKSADRGGMFEPRDAGNNRTDAVCCSAQKLLREESDKPSCRICVRGG